MTLLEPALDYRPLDDRFANPRTYELGAQRWPSNEPKTLRCCRVIQETHDVKTFEFRTGDGMPVSFEPGQFLTVSAGIAGQTVQRCYTISSPPTRPYLISITVKRVPNGVMSNWLHANLLRGSRLIAYGPSGVFTSTSSTSSKLLYLSGGSGVTPVMSMTRTAADLGDARDIVFVHSARTPEDIIFREELHRLTESIPSLRTVFVCQGHNPETKWDGAIGLLSLDLLRQFVPDFAEREVYTCGPAPYMHAVRDMLRDGGHDPAAYHQESFDIADGTAPEPAPEATDNVGDTFTVRLARTGKTFTISASETILSAARKAGVAIPSSCSQGVCGTCKTKVLEGSVDMRHNGGIRDREVQKGLRLLCCSRATSDLLLEL